MDKAPLTEHLGELRNRIVISLVLVMIAFGVCFNFSENIFTILTSPIHNTIHFSFIVSSPVIFFEVWRFIAPGLLDKERKYALPFVFTTTFLFLIGALFCFIIILPFAMNFLLNYKTENLQPMLSVGKYVDFCLKFILAFGAIFELPVLTVFLTKMGIVTPAFLAKNRKYAVLIAFILAALLTPTPDAFNQSLMAIPIIILYEVGIWTSRILDRKKKPETEQDDQEKDEETE